MNELHLFAGAGGGILAGQLLGHQCVCAVEWDPYAQAVLVARQNDGTFPPFPIWDDVRTFNGRPWRGVVDVICGGFPCQDISAAGNGDGIDGERSGLWREMDRIVGEIRPRYVFVENGPLLVGRGLAVVLGDLAEMGYDAQWFRLSASDLGAPHQRDRCWIVATPTVCGNYNRKGASATSGNGLATAVTQRTWPTATASAHKGWSPNHNREMTDDRLDYSVEREYFQPGQKTPPMRLNPEWVEWLMGWPIGHTGLKPLETGKYQEWLRQHSPRYLDRKEAA